MAFKILTVDDGKVVRIMVGRALKPFNCEIVEAVNGAEGLAAAAREKPDLILLDVTMPIMDGLEMLGRLRADPNLKSIPVIMLTAESAQENIAHADSLGISGYVPKPFKESQLVDKVKAVLALV
ncbi:MAG: response regulator [Pedosphaera sp.]|nr:response regulator [Pedosphaera sp.]